MFLFPKMTLKNIFKCKKEISNFFKENHDYDIIHCNMPNAAFLYFYYAKKYGVNIRIMHSHQDKLSDNKIHAIRNIPLIFLGKLYTTNRMACSKQAGDFLFKNKNFDIIKNAIEAEKFMFNSDTREKIRKQLDIKDEFLIGNIGRLTEQKNQMFLIDIFKEIKKKKKKSKLLIIGNGNLRKEIINKVKKYNLEDDFILIDSTDKVNEYMQAIDVFALPSLYEGLGIVNIEAETSGLHIIVSDTIPKDVEVVKELVDFLSLDVQPEIWAEKILQYSNNYERKNTLRNITESGYNIKQEANNLLKIYKSYVGE